MKLPTDGNPPKNQEFMSSEGSQVVCLGVFAGGASRVIQLPRLAKPTI